MKNMSVSDIIFDFLYRKGVRHVFVLSGGGNIFMVDALGRSKLSYVCNYHEQACATAAEAYSRLTGMGVSLVTSGPGGTNAITGVAGAWLDSIPTLTLSGQVKTDNLGTPGGMRQLGPQEINIIDMVKPITKYAVTVMDPYEIMFHLEKAWHAATSGRQGSVWLDIPLDVQGAMIDPRKLKKYKPVTAKKTWDTDAKKLTRIVKEILIKLENCQRPVLYAGHGIRLAGAHKEFLTLVDLLGIPVITSYVGYDMLPSNHPYYFGRAHSMGQRAGNFIVQNSDFFLSIGARLDLLTIGFNYKAFARAAYKVIVDIDKREIRKKTISADLPVNYDAKQFIVEMIRQLRARHVKHDILQWLQYGRRLQTKFPNVSHESRLGKSYVNPYHFIDVIGKKYLRPGEIIVESDGVGPLNCMYQAFYVKKGQRIILNLGLAQMGYGLPAAIGAAFATQRRRRIVCFEGDGSLQLNIHELQVMKHYNLPVKLFVYSNDGYLSIQNTQDGLFKGRHVASDGKSGVSSPDFVKVGRAYGIKSIRINNHKDMEAKIRYALSYPGPILVDIHALRNMKLAPKLQTKKMPNGKLVSPTLENMAPFISDQEMKNLMIIPMWSDDS